MPRKFTFGSPKLGFLPSSERVLKDSFSKNLVGWFHANKEDWFFRKNRNPYRVWVSEVALQQTRIAAALQPMQRFLTRFPDVESLAAATEDETVQAFQGLGYYNRARNLNRGAKFICQQYHGQFPEIKQELLKIPSIGDYTASAIASICFNEREAVVDANVRRVMSRILELSLPVQSAKFTIELERVLKKLIQNKNIKPGDFNEALMQLGQQLCTKSKPLCDKCPVQKYCLAHQEGMTTKLPLLAKKPTKLDVIWNMQIIENSKGEILFDKPADFYFLKGHAIFPSEVKVGSKVFQSDSFQKSKSLVLCTVKTTITKHKISAHIQYLKRKSFSVKNNNVAVKASQVENFIAASALLKPWRKFQQLSE